jgi:hypothetical protein
MIPLSIPFSQWSMKRSVSVAHACFSTSPALPSPPPGQGPITILCRPAVAERCMLLNQSSCSRPTRAYQPESW